MNSHQPLVLVLEPRPDLRAAFGKMISFIPGFTCCGEYDNLDFDFADIDQPDLVIFNIDFVNMISKIVSNWKETKWIVVTPDIEDPRLTEAVLQGTTGIYSLQDSPSALWHMIRDYQHASPDEKIMCVIRKLAGSAIQHSLDASDFHLTKKEKLILKLISEAVPFKEIAGRTGNTYETIRTHTKNIYRKLEVETASEAMILALKMNLD